MNTDVFVIQLTTSHLLVLKTLFYLKKGQWSFHLCFPPTPFSQDHLACGPANAFISSTGKGETSGLYLSEL